MQTPEASDQAGTLRRPGRWLLLWFALAVANCGLWFAGITTSRHGLSGSHPVVGAVDRSVRGQHRADHRDDPQPTAHLGSHRAGSRWVVASLGTVVAWLAGMLAFGMGSAGGGAWGRPLRLRGQQRHPELRLGASWTRGAKPSTQGLDAATCAALEALWLHDAQKEHASVPAFARIAWLLSAVGAPPELMRGASKQRWKRSITLSAASPWLLATVVASIPSSRCPSSWMASRLRCAIRSPPWSTSVTDGVQLRRLQRRCRRSLRCRL